VGRDDAGKAAQRHSLNAAGATGNAKEKVAPHHQHGMTTQAQGRRPQMVHYCAAKAGVTGFTTFLSALRHHCSTAIRRPIDGESFRTYVEKVLVPTLHPGDIVIMDNLGSHKAKAVRQFIRAAGAKLFFLSKYSPDLNPIEQVFAKIKHFLRKVAVRSVETICCIRHAK
jgi:transposase